MTENNQKVKKNIKGVDTKEFELPDTLFIRDIENTVFQGIILQCLTQIEGITLIEGNFIDSIFGRSTPQGAIGISAEQDTKNQTVNVKIELNVCYGISIPEKAEEIQYKVTEEITRLTGAHVAAIHVIFKNIVTADPTQKMLSSLETLLQKPVHKNTKYEEEYSDSF